MLSPYAAPFRRGQVVLSGQAHWTPKDPASAPPGAGFGHVHLDAMGPFGSIITEPEARFVLRAVLHKTSGTLIRLHTTVDSVFSPEQAEVTRQDINFPGNVAETRVIEHEVVLSTRNWYPGWRRVRFAYDVETIDGDHMLPHVSFPVFISGSERYDFPNWPSSPHPFQQWQFLTGLGWHNEPELGIFNQYQEVNIGPVPVGPVRGMHTFYVAGRRPHDGELVVTLNRTHPVPGSKHFPAVVGTTGIELYHNDEVDHRTWVPITVDTTALDNGWHHIQAMNSRANGKVTGGSIPMVENLARGIGRIVFEVEN